MIFASDVPVVLGAQLSLRIAQVVDDQNDPEREMSFKIELEDGQGRRVEAFSDWSGGMLAPWYERPAWLDPSNNCSPVDVQKTVLSSVRIPLGCFTGEADFNTADVRAVHVSPEQSPGVIAITDLSLG